MDTKQPEIFVLGGPNGAGKSTVADVLLPDALGVTEFVNADLIAKGLSPHSPDASAIQAGRMMLTRIRALRDERKTFGFETTLASKTFAPFLRDAQQLGYVVHLVYVALRNPDLAVNRVRLRVSRGGHHIPEETVRRRYTRSLSNFFQLYRPLAEGWAMWDNSEKTPVLVARGAAGEPTDVADAECWEQMTTQGGK